jgi:acylphosphatase
MGGLTRVYVRVAGVVQGVGFRYFTQRKARELGLAGYVRNLPDGDVEMEVEGPSDRISALVGAASQGPPGADVREVHTDERLVEGAGSGFEVRF